LEILPQTEIPAEATDIGPLATMRRFMPRGEAVRFLMVGACNTAVALVLFWSFGGLFTRLFPHLSPIWVADAAQICSTPISITFSFLGFKHFVFKTKGNYIKEWLRCFAVYSVTIPASLFIIALATKLFLLTPLPPPYVKYPAGIMNAGILAIYSYFGHKKFSFKR
jgi:putative flippase GtrA